jgi:AcrR family transcriptional regulator
MKKKPPKTYHHGDLREALVKAGRQILERDGAAALTLRACARTAGVSHAAPQHHFPTVADLLAEIAATGYEDFYQALDDGAANEDAAAAKLQAMGRSYVAFAKAHPAVYKLMFGGEAPPKSERLQLAMEAAWNQLTSAVTAAYGADEAQFRAVSTWSLVHGFAMLAINHRLPPTLDQARALEMITTRL